MSFLRKYWLVLGLCGSLVSPAGAQVTLTPRVNVPLPVGPTREYGTPRIGCGVEASYWVFPHWGVVVARDRYRFALSTGLETLNVNSTLIALLNLPETIRLDLQADSWNGGFRYRRSFSRLMAYVGVEASTNRITAQGYGLSVSQRYWGVAPVVGAEWTLTPRWSGRLDTRLQTIFIREDIPFVEEVIDRHLIFIPIQLGVVAKLAVGRSPE